MDYTPSSKRRRTIIKPEISALLEAYPHDLQMYKVPPKGQVSLLEFQDLAIERQKVLQLLEAALAQQHKTLAETKLAFINLLKKEGFHRYSKLVNATGCGSHDEEELEARKRDHLSHFILRMAYSLKDDLQQFFMTHETELFKLRFDSLDREGLSQFLVTSGFHYTSVSPKFKDENREELVSSTAREADFENTDFYELPFDEVVELIGDRRVYLHKGTAYVPQNELRTVFISHFRSYLTHELNRAKKLVHSYLDDERLQHFLKTLPECFSGMSKVVWTSENTPIDKLNELSKTSYPLCMRVMHENLITNHHLKNTGRIQYGLFLKGINVSLDDSIEFWRRELTKRENMNDDKFNKEYLYHIKYNYGKMGRRVDYRPYACVKLVTEPVLAGDIHGCPYKHWDVDELTKKLNEYKIAPVDVVEITRLASEGQYCLACTKYFDSTHKQPPGRIIAHPNQYFEESRAVLTKDEKKVEDMSVDMTTPISPEKMPQPIKVKVESSLNTSNSVTPSRTIEKKVKTLDRKSEKRMDPVNIEALLNDDSD